jgi:hypothetical protein
MKKVAADLIASEMFRLLKKASENDADMAKDMSSDDASDSMHDSVHDGDMVHDKDMMDDASDLHEFLMHSDGDSENDVSYLDDQIDAMDGMANDDLTNDLMREEGSYEMMNDADGLLAKASDMRLMTGLGRIEASLRNKGEGFAADLVRATASSIKEDIVKEASQRNFVVKNLVKMASDLDRRGDREAARMVKSTIMKINR